MTANINYYDEINSNTAAISSPNGKMRAIRHKINFDETFNLIAKHLINIDNRLNLLNKDRNTFIISMQDMIKTQSAILNLIYQKTGM